MMGFKMNKCPACGGKTTRDPAVIVNEIKRIEEARLSAILAKDAAKERARAEFERTHVQVPVISEKTGKELKRWAWIPKSELNDRWIIPRLVSDRYFDTSRVAPFFIFKFRRIISFHYHCEKHKRTHFVNLPVWLNLFDLIIALITGKPIE